MSLFRKEKKVTLTRNQAMYISYCLERLRLGYEDSGMVTVQELRNFEDTLDSQVWGSKYVESRRSESEQRRVNS